MRAVFHLSRKNSTSLESLFFSTSIKRSRSIIRKIVVELQLFIVDHLQAKCTSCRVLFRSIVRCVLCTNGDILAILSGLPWKHPRPRNKFLSSWWTVFPITPFFSSGNNQKSQGARSGKYGDAEELREIYPRWIWK